MKFYNVEGGKYRYGVCPRCKEEVLSDVNATRRTIPQLSVPEDMQLRNSMKVFLVRPMNARISITWV